MRSARCASAPSHPFHLMPSRITRNSHRPRASYNHSCLCSTSSLVALKLDGRSPSAEKLTRMDTKPNFSREVKLQWAGSREKISASGRGGSFFLTLFIELMEAEHERGIQGNCGRPHRRSIHGTPSILYNFCGIECVLATEVVSAHCLPSDRELGSRLYMTLTSRRKRDEMPRHCSGFWCDPSVRW